MAPSDHRHAMSCAEVVELVTAYLEDALDPHTTRRVRSHLTACPGCASYLEQMRETIRLLGQVPLASLSAAARHDLLAAFRSYPSDDSPG